jgi:hypothetical protein
VRTLSSVGTAVLGNVKIVLLLALSSLLLGEITAWSPTQLAGSGLTFAAAFSYSIIRQLPGPRRSRQPKADEVALQAPQRADSSASLPGLASATEG